jgi:transcription elongation factor GreA
MSSRLGYLAEVGGDQYHDNFSYEQQTMELRMLTGKFNEDKRILEKAFIINGKSIKDPNTVFIGSNITAKLDNKIELWQIVGYGESDPKNYKLAYNTPLGIAFMGKHRGDTFNYKIGSRTVIISIIDITLSIEIIK